MKNLDHKLDWLVIGLIIIIGSLIYVNTLNVPFMFDDIKNIMNPALAMEEGSLDDMRNAMSEGLLKTRPVSNLSFAFNYYVGGYRVQGYHIVNIVIHFSTAIFLYFFLKITLSLPVNLKKYRAYRAIAFWVAMLWLVHPLATQSVTYIVQRMNSMASMFYVLSILLYAKGRLRQIKVERRKSSLHAWVWFLLCCVSGFLAIGSKEIAVTLPVVIFLYEWFFFQELNGKWIRKKIYLLMGAFGLVVAYAYFHLGSNPWRVFVSDCPTRDFTSFERLLTEFRVIVKYLGLLIYPNPDRLALDYYFPFSTSLFTPLSTFLSLLLLVFFLVFAIMLAKREKLLSFCIFWFFINLAIESSVICLEIFFEHRTYLPSMLFWLLFVVLIYKIQIEKKVILIMFLIIISLFGYWTFERNKTWQNPTQFWKDNVEKHPLKSRPYVNLAKAYFRDGNYEEAEKQLLVAYKLDPESEIVLNNMGVIYRNKGDNKKAESFFRESLQQRNDYSPALLNFSQMLLSNEQYSEVIESLKKLLDKDPENPAANKTIGVALVRQLKFEEAVPYLKNALKWRKRDVDVVLELGDIYSAMGKLDLAIEYYRKAISLDRSIVKAYYHIGVIAGLQGDLEQALDYYKKAVKTADPHFPVYYNAANLYFNLGDLDQAEQYYIKQLAQFGVAANTYNNLGLVYVQKGELKKAYKCFDIATTIDPKNKTAQENLIIVKRQLGR